MIVTNERRFKMKFSVKFQFLGGFILSHPCNPCSVVSRRLSYRYERCKTAWTGLICHPSSGHTSRTRPHSAMSSQTIYHLFGHAYTIPLWIWDCGLFRTRTEIHRDLKVQPPVEYKLRRRRRLTA